MMRPRNEVCKSETPPGQDHCDAGDWKLTRRGYWMIAERPGTPIVGQGWKLHVSATSKTGADTLRAALPVLLEAGVRFKFLMDPKALREANGKSYSRGSSGKFASKPSSATCTSSPSLPQI